MTAVFKAKISAGIPRARLLTPFPSHHSLDLLAILRPGPAPTTPRAFLTRTPVTAGPWIVPGEEDEADLWHHQLKALGAKP
jgi:hypothetical protein